MPRSSGRSGGGGFRSGGGPGRSSGGFRSYSGRSGSYSRGSSGTRSSAGSIRNNYAPSSNPKATTMTSGRQPGIGLGTAMATGMAFGGGSALGHAIMGNMFGHGYGGAYDNRPALVDEGGQQMTNPSQEEINQMKANPCNDFNFKFVDCLKASQNDISKCQNIFDDLISCEKSISNIK